MFQILDGREHFYQWDMNRKLVIGDDSIREVHFCNRTDSCSLTRQTYTIDGIHLVDVPNILLQTDWRINVYAYDGNHTKHSAVYKVVSRTRPENYVFTDEEVKCWEALENRVSAIENAKQLGVEEGGEITHIEPNNLYFKNSNTEQGITLYQDNDGALHIGDEDSFHARMVIGEPENANDATTKNYVDRALSAFSGNFDAHAFGIPVLELTGDVSAMTKDNAVDLDYVYGDKNGNCSVKWQGSSSLSYPKKNYTIKFEEKTEIVEAWGAQKKYCAKANYIDFSHARNVVNAKLWGQIVKSRENVDSRLLELPNGGAIDGFPIIITINGEFQGLYTLNIPKDGWMMGMGDGEKEAIVCADYHVPATQFKGEADLATDFELEYNCDTFSQDEIKASLNTMLKAVADSNGNDIDTTIAKYLDIDSAIDYLIFVALIGGADMTDKNYLLATYDGVKWFFSAYDMDTTYGINWDGAKFYPPFGYCTLSNYKDLSKIMDLICRYKTDVLKARYQQIRAIVMSEGNLHKTFYNFACGIPQVVRMEDAKRWPTIPSTSASSVEQILDWFRLRCGVIDLEISKFVQETPPEDIPTEGNIFTYGNSYNDWELASSGASIPSMVVNAAEGYVEAVGTLDGTAIYLRKTKYPKTSNQYTYSCKFSAADMNEVLSTRVLLRCFDANGNVLKTPPQGFAWLDFYNAFYTDLTSQTFTLPEDAVEFQIGFLFKPKTTQGTMMRVSDVELQAV